jgi:hypothetical protein
LLGGPRCLQTIDYMHTLNICYTPDYVLSIIYDSPEYIFTGKQALFQDFQLSTASEELFKKTHDRHRRRK